MLPRRSSLQLLQCMLRTATAQAQQPAHELLPAYQHLLLQRTVRSSFTQLRAFSEPALAEDDSSSSAAVDQRDCTPQSRRSGVIAVKAGMTQEWDQWGVRVPLTVLWIDDCQVVQVKATDKPGFVSLQLGAGVKREKQLHPRQVGHYAAAGVPLKRRAREFKVTEDCALPVGTELTAAHFVAGQFVDVQGTTIGKGFQGVMKRWGFAGGNASHGASKSHRLAGSTGGCQDPGKVWPGKKMAGRMGGVTRTTQNCFVYKVDPARNLLYLRGQIPGHRGNFVYVRDSVKKTFEQQPSRPIPTWSGELPPPSTASPSSSDPFDYRE